MKARVQRSVQNFAVREFKNQTPLQAAAICYRRTEVSVEFLLVNTSAGKWTFPKGRVGVNVRPNEAAAQEALEEAGASGQIADRRLGHYRDLKRALGQEERSCEIVIAAYLMEVASTTPPMEAGRNPTWFSPEEARARLAERRDPRYADELARMVDAALRRLVVTPRRWVGHR